MAFLISIVEGFHKGAHIDPARLMSLVTHTEGAQFTPAGVLRLPLDGAHDAGRVLDLLERQLKQLTHGPALSPHSA